MAPLAKLAAVLDLCAIRFGAVPCTAPSSPHIQGTRADKPAPKLHPVYIHRADGTDRNTTTVMCAAPIDLVDAYGSEVQDGLRNTFVGGILLRNAKTGALRSWAAITVVREPPPAAIA